MVSAGSAEVESLSPPGTPKIDGSLLHVQTALRDAGCARDGAHSSNPSANDTAAAASFILRDVKRVMRSPMLLLGTVCKLSKFAAQA